MTPSSRRTVSLGLVAGAIGYAVVVAFYALWNLAEGRSAFHTADLLGRALLRMGPAPAGGPPDPAPIAVFNGLHLVVFLGIGVAAAWLVHTSERHPELWYLLLVFMLVAFFHLFGAVAAFTAPVHAEVPLWSILVASGLATVAMGVFLWRTHPGLAAGVRRAGDLEDPLST